MFRPDMKKFARKVMALMVLVAALVVLSSGLQDKRASASVVCCSTCVPQYEQCLADCPNPGMCNPVCNFQLKRCQNTCSPSC